MDSQNAHFADIKQFKIGSHFADFEQVKIDPTHFFTHFGKVSYFTESEQGLSLPKTIPTLSVWPKIQEFKNHT